LVRRPAIQDAAVRGYRALFEDTPGRVWCPIYTVGKRTGWRSPDPGLLSPA
jgi:hypothetical protein